MMMKASVVILVGLSFLGGLSVSASAEDEPVTPLVKAPKSEGDAPLISTKLKPSKKGKRREQKETEGTEALGRFQADTILKSPYNVDGQPLEVDPD